MTGYFIRTLAIATVAVSALTSMLIADEARADIVQPWCLSGGGGLTDHCDFATYAQCQATAAGFGVCSPNPNFSAAPMPAPEMSARRSKR